VAGGWARGATFCAGNIKKIDSDNAPSTLIQMRALFPVFAKSFPFGLYFIFVIPIIAVPFPKNGRHEQLYRKTRTIAIFRRPLVDRCGLCFCRFMQILLSFQTLRLMI